MNDWQLVGLILAVIYAFECFFLVGHGNHAFSRWWRGGFRRHGPGLALKNPYPCGEFFRVKEGDAWFEERGVFFRQGTARIFPHLTASEPFQFYPYESLAGLRQEDKDLILDGRVVLSCPNRPAALKTLSRVCLARETPRASLAKDLLLQRLDSEAVRSGLKRFRAAVFPLRLLCQALFLDLGVVLPVLFTQVFRWPAAFLASLGLGLVLFLAAPAAVYAAAKKLFPGVPHEARSRALAAGLSPLSAMRSVDLLAQDFFHDAHPLAMALELCAPGEFEEMARRALLDLRHPGKNGALPAPGEMAPEVARVLESWLESKGTKVSLLLAPPEPSSPASLGYCPCCLAQYARPDGACKDCGVDLAAF
jgi:hypothetical protein